MKINEEQFNKASKILSEVSLSSTEKKSMLEGIYANSPVPSSIKAIPSPFANFSIFFVHQRTFIALATLVLMITGTTYASAGSLPGNPLYEMKVGVLEPIGLALRFNEKAKNEYKIALLKERVLEIQTLKTRGKINKESEMISSIATRKNVADLEASAIYDDDGMNAEVSTQIETYNSFLPEKLKVETFIKPVIDILDKKKASSTKSKDDEDSASTDDHDDSTDTAKNSRETKNKNRVDDIEKVIDQPPENTITPPVTGGAVAPTVPATPNVGL